jgi:hypothetical protein
MALRATCRGLLCFSGRYTFLSYKNSVRARCLRRLRAFPCLAAANRFGVGFKLQYYKAQVDPVTGRPFRRTMMGGGGA